MYWLGILIFHIDNLTDTNAQTFTELIDSAGLQQHVTGPTHRRGHTLDLVLTRSDDNLISNLTVLGESLSDHQPVLCNIDFPRPHATRKAVLFRKTKNIYITRFQSDIVASSLVENGSENGSMSTVQDIIMVSKPKSCQLDPIPIWLLKSCIDVLLPTMTTIINASLEQGVFPMKWKESLLRPLIKKMSLDRDEFNNFRPISNLAFLSKTLEKIVASQLDTYLTKHQLYAKMQSAYRIHHSTETALLRVVNDVMRGIDDQQECVLVLLDLSSAFDTIDHNILLDRLCNHYGLSGVVLDWLKSYLCDRPQRVVVDNVSSRPCFASCGVPQGSVLGHCCSLCTLLPSKM